MSLRYQEAKEKLERLEKTVAQGESNVAMAADVLCIIHERDGYIPDVTLQQLKAAVAQMRIARDCLHEYSRAFISQIAPETGIRP